MTAPPRSSSSEPFRVTTGALPASVKRYAGVGETNSPAFAAIRPPYREISLHPSSNEPPVRVYDTSGPYTDPDVRIDVHNGLSPIRSSWLTERGDTIAYEGRALRPEDNGRAAEKRLVPEFPVRRAPLKAKSGHLVTQLEYARAGIITAEMAYVAARENLGLEKRLSEFAERLADSE